jgi:hypothetical protein
LGHIETGALFDFAALFGVDAVEKVVFHRQSKFF